MMLGLLLLCVTATAAEYTASKDKIVNGIDVTDGENNWQAILTYQGSLRCGAILVAPNKVLTAAHCTDRVGLSNLEVVTNTNTWSPADADSVTHTVTDKVQHRRYDKGPGFIPNDITILTIEPSATATTIALANPLMPLTNENCIISGFGRLNGGGPLATTMQETGGRILSLSECRSYWRRSAREGMVCIHNTTSGSCNGDSGGPLVCEVDDVPYLLGITSWGSSGCGTTYPSVYTDVSYYKDWIERFGGDDIIFGPAPA